jgi:hypothetical protein
VSASEQGLSEMPNEIPITYAICLTSLKKIHKDQAHGLVRIAL